jgi:beta-lactam-binding protein with PASTA domain
MAAASGILPRLIAFAAAALLVSATISLAADTTPTSHPATVHAATQRVLVVPDVRRQVFVFAKGMLEDRGFGWQVDGSVHGFAANKVVSQSPKPGLRVLDTGAPKITLELVQASGAKEAGAPEDRSPYGASLIRLTPWELARAKAQARKAKAAAAARKRSHKRHSTSR